MPYRLVIEPSVANVPSLEVFGRIYNEGELRLVASQVCRKLLTRRSCKNVGRSLRERCINFVSFPDARYTFGVLHVTSVVFSFVSLFVSAIVFNDIEERAVDPVDRDEKLSITDWLKKLVEKNSRIKFLFFWMGRIRIF